jgi:hypothetical protein
VEKGGLRAYLKDHLLKELGKLLTLGRNQLRTMTGL